jgi:uncharacterized membrane protein YidH (DUF202 family)
MRTGAVIGLLLVILGIAALAIHSFTFFTQERVVDTGFFTLDVQKPHTIVINPIVGIIAVIAGLFLFIAGRRPASV